MVIPKRNGKKRLCVDYRDLNVVIRADFYPLPRIEQLIDDFEK